MLPLEPLRVQAAGEVEVHDEVHAERNTVGEFHKDLGHTHALAGKRRHRVVQRIAHEPLEGGALQSENLALVVNDEPAAYDSHGVLARPQFAASGRSLRSQSVACQFEMRPSAWQCGQCQTMASSWASAASTVPFLHLKHRGRVTPE